MGHTMVSGKLDSLLDGQKASGDEGRRMPKWVVEDPDLAL